MSHYTDTHLLRFHKPPGMSYSHFRNVLKNRVRQANLVLCGKWMYDEWHCARRKGHEGDCDEIPF